jgi:hypothetical protein
VYIVADLEKGGTFDEYGYLRLVIPVMPYAITQPFDLYDIDRALGALDVKSSNAI